MLIDRIKRKQEVFIQLISFLYVLFRLNKKSFKKLFEKKNIHLHLQCDKSHKKMKQYSSEIKLNPMACMMCMCCHIHFMRKEIKI